MARTENPRVVQLLRGHTNADNAYVIEDYPYGSLRTTMKIWVETATKGRGKGEMRVVTQTLNPKTNKWNKPHPGTYSQCIYLYLDQQGHVQHFHISLWLDENTYCRMHYSGLYAMLNDEEKKVPNLLWEIFKQNNPTTYGRFQELCQCVSHCYRNNADECFALVEQELHGVYHPNFDEVYKLITWERTQQPMELVY